jgi:hypothetical protein
MSTANIQRGPATGGAPANFTNYPEANGIYVDGLTNEVVVGSGTSGASGASLVSVDPANPVARTLRTRVPIASVNAGATLLPAITGKKYRLIDATAVAIGGDVGAVTTVDIGGTQSASGVKLVAFAQASLTRSTVLHAGDSGAAVLADGASFAQNDANTAITIGKTGASATTATAIDITLTYAIEV